MIPKLAISATVLWALVNAFPAAAAEGPTDQIRATVDKALAVLSNANLKPESKTTERREQLRQILFARFDFTEMAKRSLGSNWRRRSAKEQEEFVRLFTDLLERAYVDNIESYTDEKFIYLGEKLDGDFAEVASKIVTSRGEEFAIHYKTHRVDGEWKVYDVVIENISLVNNYRSQFNRVIANGSYEELLRRLKDKQSQASSQKK